MSIKRTISSILIGIVAIIAFVVLFILAMAFGGESTYDKMQEERWEQSYSPYGG